MAGQRTAPVARRGRKKAPLPSPKPAAARPAAGALARRGPSALARAEVAEDILHASELAEDSLATNTRRAYLSDIRDWQTYAAAAGTPALPADPIAIAAYIANMDRKRQLSPATIRRRCAALAHLHKEKGHGNPLQDPRLAKVLKGLARSRGTAQHKKAPMTADILYTAILHPKTSVRDKALLLVGVVTGMRRSELVAMRWVDLAEHPEGIIITIPRSKTDKESEGQIVALPRHPDPVVCPVAALATWKKLAKHKQLVFPFSEQTVADRVKRAVTLAGGDPTLFSGHSLRAGMMTTAGSEGVALQESMVQSRHKDPAVAAGYTRFVDAFKNRTAHSVLNALSRMKAKP